MKTKGETRAGDVLLRIRDDILSCRLTPGEKLRFEILKDRYEVSFSTLREALARLSEEGLVLSEGQRGFAVAPVSIADLEDLTNARVLLDRELMRLSMQYGDDSWEAGILAVFHRMERLQERLGDNYQADAEWTMLHSKFHTSLVSACRSPLLLEIRQKLFDRAHRYRRMSAQFRTSWRPKEAEHKIIRDAVLDRSPEALDLIERHIRETTENVLSSASHLFSADAGVKAA
ncbi:GntR family transcriptional regulator [Rhizobium sp. Leaf262]|uniref:GntR family transcriptional regulator n=1 Tax=Rhizobium sp. Leaf262 TaxID=1736312 RepID=UPI000712566E|nr:GntR family transcriptional regulator [Rhizobium sp. Leaf262]KQO77494.1 GntR family transcriptional regulator [Rhizobium sp. Leaf262]